MITICVYVPQPGLDTVKQAMFDAGGGRIGSYDNCCFVSAGIGQFRPLAGSNPRIGDKLAVNQLEEWKLEMVCAESNYSSVIAAMLAAHPYETPAWHAVVSLSVSL